MKKTFIAIALVIAAQNIYAQNFEGRWQGVLEVNKKLRVVFHITNENGKLAAKMDSPDQGVKDIPFVAVQTEGDSITLVMPGGQGQYTGMLTGNTIKGALQQRGHIMALDMERGQQINEFNRPQTPAPPFNYKSEDVIYKNADGSIQYGATVTIPQGKGPFPAVLLVTGSGPQNRDEEIFEHKPFAVIANYLTNNGYVVLRVDDRGIGKTTGDAAKATTNDFVNDAKTSLQYLRTRPEVNKNKTGIIGHSEGGLIAEIIAAEDEQLDFIVLMAAPGIPIPELMAEQNNAVLATQGLPKDMVADYMDFYRAVAAATVIAKNPDELKKGISKAIEYWRSTAPKATVAMLTGISNDSTADIAATKFASNFGSPWMLQFFKYKPAQYLEQIACKVLALNGSKDIQVSAASNLEGISKGLEKSKSKKYEIRKLDGLNHLFQKCTTCNVEEYKQLEETISPVALQTIKDWLDKEVK